MRFTVRIDRLYKMLLSVSCLIMLVLGPAPMLETGLLHIGSLLFLLVMWGMAFFCIWMWINTDYIINQSELIIRSGPFKKTVPLDKITKVMPVKSIASSAAFSLTRLEILYGKWDMVHVSPLEQEKFLNLLKERCPQAKITTEDGVY